MTVDLGWGCTWLTLLCNVGQGTLLLCLQVQQFGCGCLFTSSLSHLTIPGMLSNVDYVKSSLLNLVKNTELADYLLIACFYFSANI